MSIWLTRTRRVSGLFSSSPTWLTHSHHPAQMASLHVPSDRRGVLELMRSVEDAVEKFPFGQKPRGEGAMYRKSGTLESAPGRTFVASKGKTMDQADASTEVAQENAPVRLHCLQVLAGQAASSPSTRCYGLRREMRKRREAADQECRDGLGRRAEATAAAGDGA